MRFTCDKKQLQTAVNYTQRAVSTKSALPALEGLLINAADNLTISGYDLEIGIDCVIEANIIEKGNIVINARIFGEIVRKLPDDIVTVSADDRMLTTIKSGTAEFVILGTPAADFPEMPRVTGEKRLSLDQQLLKRAIRQTIFAVAQNDQKPVLTGSLFDIDHDILKVVSVDGYRLAIKKETIKNTTGEDKFSFIVPGKTLNEILKMLGDEEKEIGISLTQKHIIFELDNIILVSRLLTGEFLNYDNAIPKDSKLTIKSDVSSFMDSTERASLLINEKIKSPVRIRFEKDIVKVSCTTAIGRVYDEFHVESNGDVIEMGFSNRYLLDALKACETEKVRIDLLSSLSPMIIRPIEGDDFLFLVLPVRLKNED